jgi:hypothetical protein
MTMPMSEIQRTNCRRSGLLLAAIALGFFVLVILKYTFLVKL